MKNNPNQEGTPPSRRTIAHTNFFENGGAVVEHEDHRHIFTISPDAPENAHITVERHTPEGVSETRTDVSAEEAFQRYWVLVNLQSPRDLLIAVALFLRGASNSPENSGEPEPPTGEGSGDTPSPL